MEARLPFSSDYAVTVRGDGSVGEGADCPEGALNRRPVQDAIAVAAPGTDRGGVPYVPFPNAAPSSCEARSGPFRSPPYVAPCG